MKQPTLDLIGRTIGEYRITSRIGAGGMGVVFEGTHPLIGKRVAVKVLLPSLTSSEEQVGRFLSEARAVNAVRHRGIVDIFSFGQLPDGSHYFVMEYLEGMGFERVIPTRGPLLVGEALLWVNEVLEALAAAHEVGIIHRDIKPSNLFLVDTGRSRPYVKLLDFGIAKVQLQSHTSDSPQTRASVVVGTPEYMSPEQVRGLAIGPATDLYALGVVLYEMLTRRRLFPSTNPLRAMWMHAEEPPPLARDSNADVPREVDDLVQWMLRKQPADRPGSAEVLLQHFEAILRRLPPELGPEASPAFTGRPNSSAFSRSAPKSATAIPPPGPAQHPPLPVLASRARETRTRLSRAATPQQGLHRASTAKVPALERRDPSEPQTGLHGALDLPQEAADHQTGLHGALDLPQGAADHQTGLHGALDVPHGAGEHQTGLQPALEVPWAGSEVHGPGTRLQRPLDDDVVTGLHEALVLTPTVAVAPGSRAPPPAGTTGPGSAVTADLPAFVPQPPAPSKTTLSRRLVELERRLLGRESFAGKAVPELRSALQRAHKAIEDADTEAQRRTVATLLDRLDGGLGG